MAYRDLDKRRQTTKERVRRYRALQKNETGGVTPLEVAGVKKIIKTKEDAKELVTKKLITPEGAARKFTICPEHKIFRYTCRCP